jgi:hypothetical protein
MKLTRQARQEKHYHKLHGGGILTEFTAYREEEHSSSKFARPNWLPSSGVKKTNSVVSVRKANYTDRSTAACRRS